MLWEMLGYVAKLLYSLQCRNLQIISDISLLSTLANPGVDINLFLKSMTSQFLKEKVVTLGFASAIKKLNSMALVRTRTIPTEQPLPVGEVSANFCG